AGVEIHLPPRLSAATSAEAASVAGNSASVANAEKTWRRTKNGMPMASATAGRPRSSDNVYGAKVAAPHSEPQRSKTAVSDPERRVVKSNDKKSTRPICTPMDPSELATWRHMTTAQPATAQSPIAKPKASSAYSLNGLPFHRRICRGKNNPATCPRRSKNRPRSSDLVLRTKSRALNVALALRLVTHRTSIPAPNRAVAAYGQN